MRGEHNMTKAELAKNIVIYFNDEDHDLTEENINNFCNIYATSYEEYMYIYELLMDSVETWCLHYCVVVWTDYYQTAEIFQKLLTFYVGMI